MATFFGKGYGSRKPEFTYSPTLKMRLPKGMPDLPFAIQVSIQQNPDIPLTDKIIGLDLLRAVSGHVTGSGTCAVLIDTGIEDHPDLNGKLLATLSATEDLSDTHDLHGHGTHLAGLIAGRAAPFMGVAPDANLISIKVTRGACGSGSWSAIYNALQMVIDDVKGEKPMTSPRVAPTVVNLAFNGLDRLGLKTDVSHHRIIKQIEQLQSYNIPVVISGGNIFEELPGSGLGYPATGASRMKVGASFNFPIDDYRIDSIGTFSQRYKSMSLPGSSESTLKAKNRGYILAPGVSSLSLGIGKSPDNYSIMSGSSPAAALVTGAILLLQEAANRAHMKPDEITVGLLLDCIINSSDVVINKPPRGSASTMESRTNCFDNMQYCRLNVMAALKHLLEIIKSEKSTSHHGLKPE